MPGKLHELWLKQKGQIAEAARPFLPPGATARFVILSQTRLPNWLAPLPFSAIYGVKKRAVLVTDEMVYLLEMPLLSPTKVSGVVESHPLSGATLRGGGMGALYVGSTKLWWPSGSGPIRHEVEEALRAAQSRG